ncbi:MAG: YceI family protein [Flammeovirgaceae bacterium]
MKKLLLVVMLPLLAALTAEAQKLHAHNSKVSFFSKAAVEDIKAENTKSTSIFNVATGDAAFIIPIVDFEFEKSLMKQHFNEKYLESEKYPKSTFVGKLVGFNPQVKGSQAIVAKGKLVMHGVEREVEIPATLEWTTTAVLAKAVFKVKLEDYKIKIPKLLWQNIAEEVEVTLEFNYAL